MKSAEKLPKALKLVRNYCFFFVIVAFVVTCCMMLFLSTMLDTMELELTDDDVQLAAKLTFLNVVLVSLLLTVIDAIRRYFTVERSAKKIIETAKRITDGDFSARVDRTPYLTYDDSELGEIGYYINKMAEELSGVETLRSDFISNVSHELKTPLAVIGNYASMLCEKDMDDETRMEYAGAIKNSSQRLAVLISNILKLNKLENQQIAPKAEVYDLGEQLCECLLGFEDVWEEKDLDIETDIEDGVSVLADAEMMSLVWNNLFSNAVKFTEKGGCVKLYLKSDGDFAVVSVEDTGCGISAETGKHIFDKFYQGDTSHATQGNGLGLALVKRVIDILQGEISVESTVGKGSTFVVKFQRS